MTMKNIAVSLIALLAAVFSVNAAEISEQAKAVLVEIEKANDSVNTLSSPLTEIKTMPNGRQFVSTGDFYFSSPDLLAIRYTSPAGDYLVVNAEEIAQKKKNGKSFKFSLEKNETMKTLSSTLLWCVSGKLLKLAEANKADVNVSESGDVLQVVLTAEVKTERGFKKIELCYDKTTMRLKSMAMTDKNNVVTKYTMDKPQYGVAIDSSVFQI
jgi:outer membrane lipoprotein-sorting protein